MPDTEPETTTEDGSAESSVSTDQPTSEMTREDWMDVEASEFVDFTESAMGTKIGFVFEHPELGLHGFQFEKDTGHLRPVSFSEVSD